MQLVANLLKQSDKEMIQAPSQRIESAMLPDILLDQSPISPISLTASALSSRRSPSTHPHRIHTGYPKGFTSSINQAQSPYSTGAPAPRVSPSGRAPRRPPVPIKYNLPFHLQALAPVSPTRHGRGRGLCSRAPRSHPQEPTTARTSRRPHEDLGAREQKKWTKNTPTSSSSQWMPALMSAP